MRKTTRLLAGSALASLFAAAAAAASGWSSAAAFLFVVAAAAGWLARAGHVTTRRQERVERGMPDLFIARNAERSESALRSGGALPWSDLRRRIARRWFGQTLLVADTVVVAPLDAIRATLSVDRCLDGMPFMSEMERCSGRTFRVYRVVDKIYDYGRSKQMRRIDDCVLLLDTRCDGSEHGGCEAMCYLLWKSAWLQRVDPVDPVEPAARSREPATALAQQPGDGVFRCQYTQLTAASHAMRETRPRAWLAPLVCGNVTLGAFLVALQTRAFNLLQRRRGGAIYPSMPTPTNDTSMRWDPLQPGDRVRVKSPEALAPAMNRNSKHRGLWFDRDMLKHCGQERRVMARVGKIIDIHSGRMIPMKTPCIVLDGVDYSGEFQTFGEQHDYLYWREAWLERLDEPTEAQAAARSDAFSK